MSAEVVGPVPTVAFHGGPDHRARWRSGDLPKVAYVVPKDTRDPRWAACDDHRVACDCREAEHAEDLAEHRAEWGRLHDDARRALAGHQVDHPFGTPEDEAYRWSLCLCSGCVLHRANGNLLRWADVDFRTGRVKPVEPEPVPF